MEHLILGTAGHVDHGKTALVKALTGIDCDTHKEEKLRGITINLGFAHLSLPDGSIVSIIDVPGHRDFVNTMVAGASGIDIVLLIVAGDNGVMPQTREHFEIMKLLGVQKGIIVITRIDLAESDILELTIDEIKDLTKDSFLQDAPIVKVSSKTGEGIEQLKQNIAHVLQQTKPRNSGEIFRMYIDRIFSVSGFGTVVTGSVLQGHLDLNTPLFILPGEKEVRIRRMERHGKSVESITAGDRASLNLIGLTKEEFHRGMLLSDRKLNASQLIDATITLFPSVKPLQLWSQAVLIMGTFEAQVRIHLIDKNKLFGGDTALVQIHLPTPCIGRIGDRFILRSTSSDQTLGGGEIIDPTPLHHRRRPKELVENLSRLREGQLPELIAIEVKKHFRGISIKELSEILNTSYQEIEQVAIHLSKDIVILKSISNTYLIEKKEIRKFSDRIIDAIKSHHKRKPLETDGRTIDELVGIIGLEFGDKGNEICKLLLDRLVQNGSVKQVRHTYALSSHTVSISPLFEQHIKVVEDYFIKCELKAPSIFELREIVTKEGIDEKALQQILRFFVKEKRIYPIEDTYIHSSVVNPIRLKLLQALKTNQIGFTVAQFRDLIKGNRKICLLLYALFDQEGITKRIDDVRVITELGMKQLQ